MQVCRNTEVVGLIRMSYQIQYESAVTYGPEPRAKINPDLSGARAKLQMPFTPATEIGISQLELVSVARLTASQLEMRSPAQGIGLAGTLR